MAAVSHLKNKKEARTRGKLDKVVYSNHIFENPAVFIFIITLPMI